MLQDLYLSPFDLDLLLGILDRKVIRVYLTLDLLDPIECRLQSVLDIEQPVELENILLQVSNQCAFINVIELILFDKHLDSVKCLIVELLPST